MSTPDFLNLPLYPTEPELVIVRQPIKRGYRFRYQSEGQTHGGIQGESKEKEGKGRQYPKIQLVGYNGQAKVVLTIVTAECDSLHAHSLIVDKKKKDGFHVFHMQGKSPTLELKTIAIQHAEKANIVGILMDRILQSDFLRRVGWSSSSEDKFTDLEAFTIALRDRSAHSNFTDRITNAKFTENQLESLKKHAEEKSKTMKMNICRFCFQAFLQDANGNYSKRLPPVYSNEILDGKTTSGAPLKILRMSRVDSVANGDVEVWLLVDKVSADDVEVRFFRDIVDPPLSQPWEGFGKFTKNDVFKQACLIFRTPPYHDQNISQPVYVYLQLRRKSDPECVSEPKKFRYTPTNDRFGINVKRQKDIPFDEILKHHRRAKRRCPESNVSLPSIQSATSGVMKVNQSNLSVLNMQTASSQLRTVKDVLADSSNVGVPILQADTSQLMTLDNNLATLPDVTIPNMLPSIPHIENLLKNPSDFPNPNTCSSESQLMTLGEMTRNQSVNSSIINQQIIETNISLKVTDQKIAENDDVINSLGVNDELPSVSNCQSNQEHTAVSVTSSDGKRSQSVSKKSLSHYTTRTEMSESTYNFLLDNFDDPS